MNRFKARWKEAMNRFTAFHLQSVKTGLSKSNPLYVALILSATVVIAFSNLLIGFIDETYLSYSAGKFGASKSWHIVTKLLAALFLEMNTPRESTTDDFIPGDRMANTKIIFWNTIRSLDIMIEIQAMNFIDHPTISN